MMWRAVGALAGLCIAIGPRLSAETGPSVPPSAAVADPDDRLCQSAAADEADGDAGMRSAHIGRCLVQRLAFDPQRYFSDPPYEPGDGPTGIVDAVNLSSLHGPQWAFAVDSVCSEPSPTGCSWREQRFVLRMVSARRDRAPPASPAPAPGETAQSVRAFLDAVVTWREADLQSCPGAISALRALDHVKWFGLDAHDRAMLDGRGLDEIVVVADGDWVTVRARGAGATTVQATALVDADGSSAWAQTMLKDATPCLKPAHSPPPWRRAASP
jgi:hypothetical protein